jgi:hypothetical protein
MLVVMHPSLHHCNTSLPTPHEPHKQKVPSVGHCRHANITICLRQHHILWPMHPIDSYSLACGVLEETNISQNQPHVLAESLVKSLGEACRQLADATQGSGITARVGLSHNDAAVTSYSPSLIAMVESSCMEARKVKSRLLISPPIPSPPPYRQCLSLGGTSRPTRASTLRALALRVKMPMLPSADHMPMWKVHKPCAR